MKLFIKTMNSSLESKTLQFLLSVSWAQLGGQKVAPTTCHLCIPKCDIVLSSPLPLEEADGGWWILGWVLIFPWAAVTARISDSQLPHLLLGRSAH